MKFLDMLYRSRCKIKVYAAKTPALHHTSEWRNTQLSQTCINFTVNDLRSNIHTLSVEELSPFVSREFLLGCSRGATNLASHPVHTPFRETGLEGPAGNSTTLNTKRSCPGWYKFELQRQKYLKTNPKPEVSCTILQWVHLPSKPFQLNRDSQCLVNCVIFSFSQKLS